MRFLALGDNIFNVFFKNKTATLAGILWYLQFKKENADPRILELLASIMLIDDIKDVGQFDHVHHWMTGYLMLAANKAKQLPKHHQKKAFIADILTMFSHNKRQEFLGGKNVK